MRTWILPALAGVLVLALIATGTLAIVQTQRVAHERERGDRLEGQVDELRAEVGELQEELEAARANDGGTEDGDEGGDEAGSDGTDDPGAGEVDLEGMLDDLLGGAVPGQECLTPDTGGDLNGFFDGLFGGGGEDRPDDPDELVETIADQVAQLRELTWQEPVDAEFVATPELHERLEEIVDEDLDPAEVDASERLLSALGAIPDDADLEQLQRDLLDDQVAGYYMPSTGELVVRVPDDGQIRTVDEITLAHELDHALTDQVLGLPDRSEAPLREDADASLAALAATEGDASLVMNLWALAELSLTDQLGMAMDPSIAGSQAALDEVPYYLQQELIYPYTDGLDWACRTYLDGGWEAVDAAYAEPPATSAEVLWGEPNEPASTPSLTAPDGFEELDATTFGAVQLLWLLEAPGNDPDAALDEPEDRARGWAGGTVSVWGRGEQTAVGVSLVDNGQGSAPLCDTLDAWYEAAFTTTGTTTDDVTRYEGDQPGVLRCDGDTVQLARAPDVGTAASIVDAG